MRKNETRSSVLSCALMFSVTVFVFLGTSERASPFPLTYLRHDMSKFTTLVNYGITT